MAGESSPITKHPSSSAVKQRPPTTSILRSAMYYQNRIIAAEPPQEIKSRSPSSTHASSPATTSEISARPDINQSTPNLKQTGARETIAENSNSNINNRKSDPISVTEISNTDIRRCATMKPSSTMDSRGIDIVITDTEDGSQRHELKKYSIWKKVSRVLQDNRMKGVPDAERILAVGNPQDYKILKKVLNITFLTIGICLLVAVIIVIVYTYVGKYDKFTHLSLMELPSLINWTSLFPFEGLLNGIFHYFIQI